MKRNLLLTFALFGIAFTTFFTMGFVRPGGSPGGKTGSPGDGGTTCTQCHSGTAVEATDWISSNIPEEGYTIGNTYTITVTGTHTGVSLFGFEITAEDNAGNKTGTLAITNATETQLVNSSNAVTHTSGGNSPSGDSKSWEFNWTAADVDEVTFYAAFNAANGNGGTSGDVIYTSTLNVMKAASTNSAPVFTSEPVLLANVDETYLYLISTTDADGDALTFSFTTFPLWMALNDNGGGTGSIDGTPTSTDVGDHSVVLTVSDGVNDAIEQSFTITVQESTSVNESLSETFEVYPNPSNGKINLSGLNSSGVELDVFSLSGKMVHSVNLSRLETSVDLSKLNKGIYLIRVNSNSDKPVIRKITIL